MKNIFLIKDSIENKISFYHLALFLLVLPYDFFYSELVLISFGLHTFIHVRRPDFKNILSRQVLVLTSLYLLNVFSILYSTDKSEGLNLAVRQLGLLLFPLLFAISHFPFEKYRVQLAIILGFSCLVTVIYLYHDTLRTIVVFQLPLSSLFTGNFMNHNFSLPVGIHATYLSMYIAFSIITFLWLLLTSQVQKEKLLYIIASLILFAGLVQLSSRAVFIAFLLIINGAFPFLLFSGSRRIKFFLITAFVSAAVLLLIYSVDSFKTRYVSELKTDLTDKVKIIDNTEPRLARWEAILELVRRSAIIGYGSGSETKLLQGKYFEKGLYVSYINEFNTHNQYLAMLLKAGVVGLLLFLFVLYYGYLAAIKRKDLLLMAFVLLITIVSLSENVLDLNKGIFFCGFFFSLLLMKPAGTPGDIVKPGNPKVLNTV